MNCIKHAQSPAVATCSACAESFCNLCLVTVKGAKYCADCKGSAIKGDAIASSQGSAGVCQEAGEALKYALIGIVCFGIILEPIAIFKALKAKKMIAENPRLEGAGKATAALFIAIAVMIIWVLGLIARVSAAGRGIPD